MSRVKKQASRANLTPNGAKVPGRQAVDVSHNAVAPSAKGPIREYRITTPPKQLAAERSPSLDGDGIWVGILTVLAVAVRYYKLAQPGSVVFDEVHFGGFARKYIIGRFFMDVHPPLAKMLYAVVGWLAGYDGEFDFNEIGLEYSEYNVPYVAMRMLPATLGVFTILLAYATLRASGCRPSIAFFGGAIMTLDNALSTQSRFILLDSPLVFFIAITTYAFKRFENEVPFTKNWFRYLFLTGLGLGATVSSKWVGLFTIGWVGLLTIYQLWWLIGDLTVSTKNFVKHFLFRVIFLIAVPVLFYLAMFALHFICVVNTGDGASFMPAEFQAHLQHSDAPVNVPADVMVGSEITIRHLNTQGGYLHSHDHMYETGSQQQQITLYPHKDENNVWVVENITARAEDEVEPEFPYLYSGAVIRLRHKPTSRRLHSHDHRPPVSEQEHNNEVSAYGFDGFEGDANDNFRVEIVEQRSEPGESEKRVQAIKTKFKLIHTTTGCTLFSHNVKLPKWAFEQQEVTCIASGKLDNSLWYVEQNYNPKLGPDAEVVNYRQMGFLEKFITLNKVMWDVNAGLTDSHTWESRPESWPIMKRGINFWVKNARQVYLIGNAVSWWTVTALIGLYAVYKVMWILMWQRGYEAFKNDADYSIFDSGFGGYLLGWALHYFPSFLMARQLFLHHYLGSIYFGILGLAQFWQFLTSRLIRNKVVSTLLSGLFLAGVAAFYVWYSPLIYGNPWTKDLCEKSKFLDMDFDCNSFHSTFEEYNFTPVPDVSQQVEEPQPPMDVEDSLRDEVITILPVGESPVVEEMDMTVEEIEIPIPTTTPEEEDIFGYLTEEDESIAASVADPEYADPETETN